MKIFLALFLLYIVLIPDYLFSQSEYDLWKQQQIQKLRTFKSAQDKEFSEFLEKNWDNYNLEEDKNLITVPKPDSIPVVENINLSKEALNRQDTTKVVIKTFIPTIDTLIKKHEIDFIVDEKLETFSVDFFGLNFKFQFTKDFEINIENPISEKSIADFWYQMSNADFEILNKQLKQYQKDYGINDWGFCQLVNIVANKINNDESISSLITWFFITKMGFQSKVGFNKNEIYLLLPSTKDIYNVSYIKIDGRKFYAVSFTNQKRNLIELCTYEGKYPNSDDLIDLASADNNVGVENIIEQDFSFFYSGVQYNIPIKFNKEIIDYYNNFPQTELDVYFDTPISREAYISIKKGFTPILTGKSNSEAVNILLRFMQTAFKYKTDEQQFGQERTLFSDETLFYPYSDCEDRAILFTFLVRNLLGLEVIGLDYPGHISTAVKLDSNIEGDKIHFNGDDYLICDPTYVNANIGMCMPKFKDILPKIIAKK